MQDYCGRRDIVIWYTHMTLTANARVAGAALLVYIAAGIGSMVVMARAAAGSNVAERLVQIAAHPTGIGVVVLLGFVQSFCALILGVTLYAITRGEDRDIALFGLVCRTSEGIVGALAVPATLAVQWLATAGAEASLDSGAARALASYLLRNDAAFTATFFAAGSTAFAWLLLRGGMIPRLLAQIGVVASVLLVIALPLELAGWLHGVVTLIIWLPMLAFEVPLAIVFLARGVRVAR